MHTVVTINAKVKKMGEKSFRHVLIKIPENTKKIFESYDVEIIEYDPIIPGTLGIFIVDKEKNDVISLNIYPKLENSFQNAFEKLYDELQVIKESENLVKEIGIQNES